MSLFSSSGQEKGKLFSSADAGKGSSSLFSNPVTTGSAPLFGARKPITFGPSPGGSGISVSPPAPSRLNNPLPSPQAWSRDTAVPVGRRRQSTAASQISRKYSRLQSTVGSTPRRLSDEAVKEFASEATSDLRLCDVPRELNTIERIRSIFSRFGVIERVIPNRSKCSTVIHFKEMQSAKLARHHGNSLKGFESVQFFFHNRRSNKNLSSSGTFAPRSLKRPGFGGGDVSPPAVKTQKVAGLDGLMGVVAVTAADRLSVLDQRDRLTRVAITGKKETLRIKAVCPDMCPERERYARQEQHRLSVFEMVPGTQQVDHNRAVKEYSRSSADQEMPLPYDLRPLPVLSRTMQYLLTEIADVCSDGNGRFAWCEWFDFLWSRTRAIRKEITQLRLCDVATAAIVEQTSRFHIFAAARLCELPVDEFDQKINDENLTKCLQTLKELYHDLALKPSANRSPNEAEFRCYMILRNLNDTSILNDVTQLDPAVRASSAVRLAMEAYFAVSNNNYVRFFKLVRRATFLQACLLHRYFNQVRFQALRVMVRAYTLAGGRMQFPLAEMVTQLAFESSAAAVEFCSHHNLACTAEHVTFVRPTDLNPRQQLTCQRALTLVEAKLTGFIGDVLNGEPLPRPFAVRAVHSSFDAGRRFVGGDPVLRSLSGEVEKPPPELQSEEEEEEELDSGDEELEEGEIRDSRPHSVVVVSLSNPASPAPSASPATPATPATPLLTRAANRVASPASPSPSPTSHVSNPASTVSADARQSMAAGLQEVAERLLTDTVAEMARATASSLLSSLSDAHAAAHATAETLLAEVAREEAAATALHAIREAQLWHAVAEEAVEALLGGVVVAESREAAVAALEGAETERRLREEAAAAAADSLLATALRQLAQEAVAETRLAVGRGRRWFCRWRAAAARRRARRDARLLVAAGPPLEHSRRVAERLLGASWPGLASSTSDLRGDSFLRAVEARHERHWAPLPAEELQVAGGGRLLLLLGDSVSRGLAEWLAAKMTALLAQRGQRRVVGVILAGCPLPQRFQRLPALAVHEEEQEAATGSIVVRLQAAEAALWTGRLRDGLRRLLERCSEEEEAVATPAMLLCAFLDVFFHRCLLQPLQQMRRRNAAQPDAQRLLVFFARVVETLRAPQLCSADVGYRLVSLLELADHSHRLDAARCWTEAADAVQRFAQQQHLSQRCRSEAADIVSDAETAWVEMARDFDLHGFIQPDLAAFPWIAVAESWFNERAHELLRHCSEDPLLSVVTVQQCDAVRCLTTAAATGHAILAAPTPDSRPSIDDAFAAAIDDARRRKYAAFARQREAKEKSVETRAVERWEKLQRQMEELRAAMDAQMDESLNLSRLFDEKEV